jgi:hypothetical protein
VPANISRFSSGETGAAITLLTPGALLTVELGPTARVLDLKGGSGAAGAEERAP